MKKIADAQILVMFLYYWNPSEYSRLPLVQNGNFVDSSKRAAMILPLRSSFWRHVMDELMKRRDKMADI